jgi:hypothetical protein
VANLNALRHALGTASKSSAAKGQTQATKTTKPKDTANSITTDSSKTTTIPPAQTPPLQHSIPPPKTPPLKGKMSTKQVNSASKLEISVKEKCTELTETKSTSASTMTSAYF